MGSTKMGVAKRAVEDILRQRPPSESHPCKIFMRWKREVVTILGDEKGSIELPVVGVKQLTGAVSYYDHNLKVFGLDGDSLRSAVGSI